MIAGLANDDMTMNMVFMGVFSKSSKNADQLQKQFVNRCNSKTSWDCKWAKLSTSLKWTVLNQMLNFVGHIWLFSHI